MSVDFHIRIPDNRVLDNGLNMSASTAHFILEPCGYDTSKIGVEPIELDPKILLQNLRDVGFPGEDKYAYYSLELAARAVLAIQQGGTILLV